MIGVVLMVGVFSVLATAGAEIQHSICDIDVWDNEGRSQHHVPETCHMGTFRWNYPHGSTYLYFPQQRSTHMQVCIKNLIGGRVFAVRDVTHGIGMPFVIGKMESCSLKRNESIILRIDAPGTFVYFGVLDYKVRY